MSSLFLKIFALKAHEGFFWFSSTLEIFLLFRNHERQGLQKHASDLGEAETCYKGFLTDRMRKWSGRLYSV